MNAMVDVSAIALAVLLAAITAALVPLFERLRR
jgi:hypothetical protein